MNKLKMIREIKRQYEQGRNIIRYLKEIDNRENNTIEDILISYDFQAGTYNEMYKMDREPWDKRAFAIADIMNEYLMDNGYSLCEAGVGEATTLCPILQKLKKKPDVVYGFDISWSRMAEAIKHSNECIMDSVKTKFFVGDMFSLPFADNSIDVIYTVGALEPNGGNEEKLLMELYRVSSEYIFLFEPIYELANEEVKKRMEYHGYVKGLKQCCEKLGYNIVKYGLLGSNLREINPYGIIVIQKNKSNNTSTLTLCDPVSKYELKDYIDCMFCEESRLAYPKIQGIPLLTEENAVLATKM